MLSLAEHGAEHHPGLARDDVGLLLPLFSEGGDVAGKRLTEASAIAPVIGPESPIAKLVSDRVGKKVRAVRAIAFDKTHDANWALGWHQDRTICVKQVEDVPGYGPWTTKQGIPHVQPPFAITDAMVTVRVHVDAVTDDNAPLRIALGTHRLGKIADADAASIAKLHPPYECLCEVGDVWLYKTAILHASDRATSGSRRRVLQVDYSADELPSPLMWLLS